jgi:acyl-CoA synthetase (NDP forming)
MIKSIEQSPLYPIINPESVALYGASNNYTAIGTNWLVSMRGLGFKGKIYPIHPKEKRVLELPAFKSILDVPDVPDLVVMVLPTPIVPDILEECGRKGIKHAIVVSGGFREVGGDGVALEKKLLEVAARYGIRFLGPNCIGVINPHHRLNISFLQYRALPGFIGMASQSGSLMAQMFEYLSRFGLGFSAGISVGNEADIDIVDAMEYLAACPNTRVIGLYIESIRRGKAFVEMARSIVPHKPIVALYSGGSETGKRAAFSHTGALAGPDPLYDGAFHQSGVIRAHSVEEFYDYCWVLGSCPKPEGDRVIILTHSGGPGTVAADACGRAGLNLPPISHETLEKLAPFVPHTASMNNPVDLTFIKNPLHYFAEIPEALLEGDNSDGLLIFFLVSTGTINRAMARTGIPGDQFESRSGKFFEEACETVARLPVRKRKPFIGFSFRDGNDPFIKGLYDRGVPVIPSPERAARAMAALVSYARMREKIMADADET